MEDQLKSLGDIMKANGFTSASMSGIPQAIGGGLSAASKLNPYTAALSAIPAIFQGALGVGQAIKGAKMAKSQVRPILRTMPAQQQALENAMNYANGVAPGTALARNQFAQAQAGSNAGILGSGGGGAERMAALAMLDQNAGNQAMQIGANQEQWQSQMQMNLQNQLMQQAEAEKAQFVYNKDEPYRNAMKAAQDMRDAANKNIFGSLTSLGGSVASTLSGGDTKKKVPSVGTNQSPSAEGSPSDLWDPTGELRRLGGNTGSVTPEVVSPMSGQSPASQSPVPQTPSDLWDPNGNLRQIGGKPNAGMPTVAPIQDLANIAPKVAAPIQDYANTALKGYSPALRGTVTNSMKLLGPVGEILARQAMRSNK